jgi:hypothetical protein
MVMLTQPQPASANVPVGNAGVPNTASPAVDAVASVALATVLQSAVVQQADSQWGIFLNGQSVLTSGRVRALELQQQYKKTDAPVENGAFLSYNKVRIPRQIMVEMLCDGSTFNGGSALGNLSAITSLISTVTGTPSGSQVLRSEFMTLLDNMVADLNLYDVTTPEGTYSNMNVGEYSIQRAADHGITLLYAQIILEEVRAIPASQFTSTAQPQGQAQQNSGNVQSTPPSAGQLASEGTIT